MKLDVTKLFDKNDKIDGRRKYFVAVYKNDERLYSLKLKIKRIKEIELKDFDYAVIESENSYRNSLY